MLICCYVVFMLSCGAPHLRSIVRVSSVGNGTGLGRERDAELGYDAVYFDGKEEVLEVEF